MKAFVAGATGRTGRKIVQELVKQDISVKALVRKESKGKELLLPEVELVVGDVMDWWNLESLINDCDVLLCATGAIPSLDFTAPYRVDYIGTQNLVNAAKAAGIKHFVLVSSLFVSRLFHPLNLFWLILFWKKQAEAYLRKSGLVYTIVRPGGLKDEDNAEFIIMSSADTDATRSSLKKVCSSQDLSMPGAVTQVHWELNLNVVIELPRFLAKLPKSVLQKTGDRLLSQIVRQVSPRLTLRVQQDFHNRFNLPLPPKKRQQIGKNCLNKVNKEVLIY